jgi:diguanylate cyclase (GGDEF)-like protein
MPKGMRCKHAKQTDSYLKQIAPILLILVGWFLGAMVANTHAPIAIQIGLPIILAILFFVYKQKQKNHPKQTLPPLQETAKAPFGGATSSSLDLDFAEQTLQNSHTYQLKLLCNALNLTSGAVILHSASDDSYTLHSIHSATQDAINQNLAHGGGILLSLKDKRDAISGHPSSPDFKGLPYYKTGCNVGGFMAISLTGIDRHHPLKTGAFLCVDRREQTPWSNEEKALIHQSGEKIAIDLYVSEQLVKTNHDKKAIQQICLALQDLNTVLSLQEAFEATQNTVTSLTPATLVAITLKDSTIHNVVSVSGIEQDLKGLTISRDTCLVNQAISLQRTMTPKTNQQKPLTLFTSPSPIDTFQSLLIIPLITYEQPIGTLIAGGERKNLFNKDQQALLEVIAGQIATRIDLARTHEKVHHMATIDGLTGLVNHRTFQNGLGKMLARAKRQDTNIALILCDIDFFKKVNDNYGHPFGDEVLRQVSRVLQETVREVDLAARYGGEEFTLVLENADTKGGMKLAERIRQDIADLRFTHEGRDVQITMSFGVSSYPDFAKDQPTLISQADQALYACKEGGRNQTRCHPKEA